MRRPTDANLPGVLFYFRMAETRGCLRWRRLHALAPAFGEDPIGRERRFSGAAQAGDHDETMARDVEREIF